MQRIRNYFKHRPGLSIILFLLLVINLVSLKPGFYVVGWDNFSSYFNLKTNIFRTFFATWREYRGLGVASDSEAVDIFRQLFHYSFHFFLPETLLDQLYIQGALTVGILAIYFFACNLWSIKTVSTTPEVKNTNTSTSGVALSKADLFGFFAAFFYLFNLNTVSIFNFSMMMYVSRFFSIPLIFLIFFNLMYRKPVSWKTYLLSCLGIFFISGSYITGTILITTLLSLGIFGLLGGKKKRFIAALIFYFCLNAFWLFPFGNYTKEKSKLIRLAPTFINANEVQLNKQKSFYDVKKQLELYPNFFDTEYSDIVSTQKYRFHTLAIAYNNIFYQLVFLIFPFLYLLGCGVILRRWRRYRYLLFIPAIIFVFLFLSFKEYSPFGFIYSFLNNLTPYFGVLFRFGDTKFHAYVSFAGSLGAAFGLIYLLAWVSQNSKSKAQILNEIQNLKFKIDLKFGFGHLNLKRLLFIFFIASHIFVYREYFTGRLVGLFMYNKIPQAYFDVAKDINSDNEAFRVLHLPFDKEAYWKSYSWGAVGSAFFNFMIDKPLVDKTWEPASMENAYLHKKIGDLLSNIQSLQTPKEREQRAKEFARLMERMGIKYILFDDTVQASIYSRGIVLWGKFNNPDIAAMVDYLKEYGYADAVKTYPVNLDEYESTYSQGYPLSDEKKDILHKNAQTQIELVKLHSYAKKFTFPEKVQLLDPALKNVVETDLITSDENFMQSSSSYVSLYPFKRRDLTVKHEKGRYDLLLNTELQKSQNLKLKLPADTSVSSDNLLNYLTIYTHYDDHSLYFDFYVERAPTIGTHTFTEKIKTIEVPISRIGKVKSKTVPTTQFISDWSEVSFDEIGNLRLRVGDYIVPLPEKIAESEYVATVGVKGSEIPIELMTLDTEVEGNLQDFLLTDNPNCFNDKLTDAYGEISNTDSLKIASKNQSTCVFYDLKSILNKSVAHVEVNMIVTGLQEDLDKQYGFNLNTTAKPRLKEFISTLDKPNAIRICVKSLQVDDCYNQHEFMNIKGERNVTIPLEKPLDGLQDGVILLSLKNTGYQRQELNIKDISFDLYRSVGLYSLTIFPNKAETFDLAVRAGEKLDVQIPHILSPYSFNSNFPQGGMYISNKSCETPDGYRTFRMFGPQLLSYVENCQNMIFQPVDFSSYNFYFWTLNYNLLSGQFPKILVDDKFYAYYNEYISLYQGYPDVTGFKKFQNPEMLFDSLSQPALIKSLATLPHQQAYGFMNPAVELRDFKNKNFTVEQYSENEGIMLLDSFDVQPLPTQWADMHISAGEIEQSYTPPEYVSSSQILPSLWKISLTQKPESKTLLQFNEGYDHQWTLYTNPVGVVTGLIGRSSPSRCDGFANCYVLENDGTEPLTRTYYVFYTPERLSILGWAVTMLSIGVFGFIFTYGSHSKRNEM